MSKRRPRELRYEYGVLSPRGDMVVCADLAEAKVLEAGGGVLHLREIRTVVSAWSVVTLPETP